MSALVIWNQSRSIAGGKRVYENWALLENKIFHETCVKLMQGQREQLLSEEVQTPSEREIDSDTQPRKILLGVRIYPVVSDRIELVCNG